MKPYYLIELLHILWNLFPRKEYASVDGKRIKIVARGEYDDKRRRFCGAKVQIEGTTHHGEIVIWAGDELPQGDFESTVLHIAPFESASILRSGGEPIPQVVERPDPACCAAYAGLREGSRDASCSRHIAGAEKHERIALFTRLMADRLYGKYGEVMTVFEQSEQNWLQTVYVMLFRAMGKPYNTEAFGELARRVGYKHLCWEKGALQNAEALLLGASGLLESYEEDQYIGDLKSTFAHYCRKYDIVPMRAGEWNLGRNRMCGIPVLRLAQLASFFTDRDFMLDSTLRCHTVEDIHRLFDVEASVYWSTHYKPGETGAFHRKKIGHERANVMGINFIVPMQFAYGVYMADEAMKEGALDLLEKINPENNGILDKWRRGGTLTENAFDTQAILQIDKQYCRGGYCWRCPVGKRVVKEVYRQQSAQKM
ncbi:MAG: DUF2851 family protein [Rikenellaceae bacterium]|nr:DUF2851 family protein [Rikenellaceae bacterium]